MEPKRRTGIRKHFKLRMSKVDAVRNIYVHGGGMGLRANESRRLTSSQIEAARNVINKKIKKFNYPLLLKVFPHFVITKKSEATRMGSGKGNINTHGVVVKSGEILFELDKNIPDQVGKEALRIAASKLPLGCSIVHYSAWDR